MATRANGRRSSGSRDGPLQGVLEITQEQLDELNVDQMAEQNLERLQALGGPNALATKLVVNPRHGLSTSNTADLQARADKYGRNLYPEPPTESWFSLFLGSFEDLTIIVLCVAATISLIVGVMEEPNKGWVDGVAIFLAVFIVAFVTATNNYEKEKQFRALNAVKNNIQVKAIRDGEQTLLAIGDLLVGDIVVLESGDKIPCDGVLLQGEDVKSNESSLTGEPDDLTKTPQEDPFLLSGCQITAGSGKMVALAVGPNSRWGRIKSRLADESSNTPLQDKLDDMAKKIGYGGLVAAVLTFAAMILVWFVAETQPVGYPTFWNWLIHSFIMAVTIVVVAVPEGLPLAVTISLAYSTKKMLADHNLIRVLAACETMGNATNICSDKTGTLTENRMTVVAGWMGGRLWSQGELPTANELDQDLVQIITQGAAINSTAHLSFDMSAHREFVVGSKTEGALLMFARDLGVEYARVRVDAHITKLYTFSSDRKMMSVLVGVPHGYRLYAKGAAEIVLARCTQVRMANGAVQRMTDQLRTELHDAISEMSSEALRTVALAHRNFTERSLPADYEQKAPEDDMTLDCILGIHDPLRPDVKHAVEVCQRAGIMVRMVTGDNLETAKAIARQCGILTDGGIAVEGPAFRAMSPAQLDQILPRLQVLARSSPDDKHTLVVRLNGVKLPKDREEWEQAHPRANWETQRDKLLPGYRAEWVAARKGLHAEGEVVGVTGDGTNDAPALKAADVGLSMGLSGTEVAKEASDIVIMDDRFSSILQAVLWGRSVYDNIRKFLQFQLTVNLVALALTFLAAVMQYDPPLNAVMMLWVNLIMDTMGALALGTEPPTQSLLERRPYRRSAFLVSRPMVRNIIIQAIYQLALLLVVLLMGGTPSKVVGDTVVLDTSVRQGLLYSFGVQDGATACARAVAGVCVEADRTHFTFIFNAFVFCQIFNEFNARRIDDDWNVFAGLTSNYLFVAVIAITASLQAIIVEFGGDFSKTIGLSWDLWLLSVALGAVSLPLGWLMRKIPVSESLDSFAPEHELLRNLPRAKEPIRLQRATSNGSAAGAGAAAGSPAVPKVRRSSSIKK